MGYSGFGGALGWRESLPAEMQGRRTMMYNYGLDFTPLLASVSQSGSISINSDADFIVLAAVGVVTDVNNTTRLGFVPQLVQILDTGSGASLFSQATHYHNVFGTAELPAIWQQPRVIDKGSTVTITLQNQEAVNRNVRLLFLGAKLY